MSMTKGRTAFAAAALLGAAIVSGTLANDPPVTVPATGEEPIGTPGTVTPPTPVWETVEATTVSGEVVKELPSTGVGSAA
jgi:hypothetical protein